MSLSLDGGFRRDRLVLWFVAGLLLAALLFVAWTYVGTVMLGLFVYYVTRPVFERIHDRLGNRTLSVVVAIFAVALPVLLLTAWAGFVAVQGFVDVLSSPGFDQLQDVVQPYLDLSDFQRQVEATVAAVVADPSRITAIEGGGLGNLLVTLLGSFALLFNVFVQAFVVLVITFYLLRDDHAIEAWMHASVAPEGSVVDDYLRAVDRDLKNVYFGNILNALVTGLLGAVVYSALNVVAPAAVRIPEPLLLGLLTGAASLVPVIGMKLVWIPIAALLLVDSALTDPTTAWFPALFALVSVVVVDYIPDQLLRPYVSGRSLHVGAVMLAYVLGPLLFGWYGIFLGPFVLVVVFEFARIVVPWLVDPERESAVDGPEAPPERTVPAADDRGPAVGRVGAIPTGMLAPREEPDPDRGDGDG